MKSEKYTKNGSTNKFATHKYNFGMIESVLDRVRAATGLENRSNPPIYEKIDEQEFSAVLKNDPLCNDKIFIGNGSTKKEARIHAEAKLLCYIFKNDTCLLRDFLQDRVGMISFKKVSKFLKEHEAFDFTPSTETGANRQTTNRKRKISSEEGSQNLFVNNLLESPAKKTAKLQLMPEPDDVLLDYEEMQDDDSNDGVNKGLNNVLGGYPEKTLLPKSDDETESLDEIRIETNVPSRFTKSFKL